MHQVPSTSDLLARERAGTGAAATIAESGPAAHTTLGGAAAGPPWPDWARTQLAQATQVAAATPAGTSVAAYLYRQWFAPTVCELRRPRRPFAGTYRAAHVGSSARVEADGITTVVCHDVIGADGWWRTWGQAWTPPRTRPGSVRILFTPDVDRIGAFVTTLTGALLEEPTPWSLGIATEARRVRRSGAAVLDLPGLDALPAGLLAELDPTLLPVDIPLCLPLAPGAALAQYPANGMTFGEHRCHLVALGVRHAKGDELAAIADVFVAHGLDPARPHRAR